MTEDNKIKRVVELTVIIAVAIVLAGIVLLGLITGHWPWETEDQSGDYTGMPSQSIEDTTLPEDSPRKHFLRM